MQQDLKKELDRKLVDGEIDTEQYNQILKRVGKNSSKEPITGITA
jgi:DNA modification methylase